MHSHLVIQKMTTFFKNYTFDIKHSSHIVLISPRENREYMEVHRFNVAHLHLVVQPT
jgi:hypothetical protein